MENNKEQQKTFMAYLFLIFILNRSGFLVGYSGYD